MLKTCLKDTMMTGSTSPSTSSWVTRPGSRTRLHSINILASTPDTTRSRFYFRVIFFSYFYDIFLYRVLTCTLVRLPMGVTTTGVTEWGLSGRETTVPGAVDTGTTSGRRRSEYYGTMILTRF